VDYLAPQLYWAIDPPNQSFPVLLRWWAQQNPKGRNLCPGLDSTKVSRPESRRGWQPQEIVNQIRLARAQRGATGHIHWNMRSLMRNASLDEVLEREVYQRPALMPLSPWLGHAQPSRPKVTVATANPGAQLEIRWTSSGSGKICLWLLQTRTNGQWAQEILPAARTSRAWNRAQPDVVAVSAVNRNGELSAASVLERVGGAR
jgi:hypothetical protein